MYMACTLGEYGYKKSNLIGLLFVFEGCCLFFNFRGFSLCITRVFLNGDSTKQR